MDGVERGKLLRQEIFDAYVASNQDRRPNRIRPSELGHPCLRYLWIRYRWADSFESFEGRMLRLFETGHSQEDRMASDLRSVGAEVVTKDPHDPRSQIGFSALSGHVKGFLDGIADDVPHSKEETVLTEMKTHSSKSFKLLEKQGVAKSKPQHYGQMQIYMHRYKLEEGLYIAVNKDNDDIYCEYMDLNHLYAQGLVERAEVILRAKTIPPRITEDMSKVPCSWCSARATCHFIEAPMASCRSCQFGKPIEEEGNTLPIWTCLKHGNDLSLDDQKTGCSDYEVNDQLVDGNSDVSMDFK